jgi:hypothetical protein
MTIHCSQKNNISPFSLSPPPPPHPLSQRNSEKSSLNKIDCSVMKTFNAILMFSICSEYFFKYKHE